MKIKKIAILVIPLEELHGSVLTRYYANVISSSVFLKILGK